VTLSLGAYSTAADAFIAFQAARRHLGQRLYDLRETSLYKNQWSRFAAVGVLQIKYVDSAVFLGLDPNKRQQFRELGYNGRGSVWIGYVRMAVHIGKLGTDDVQGFFELAGPVIDDQPLDSDQATQEAVGAIFSQATNLAFASGHWPDEAIQEYLLACAQHASGRKGLKMAMRPRSCRDRRPNVFDGLDDWLEREG
jgi:hypothetical protein